ncbi:MAG: MGMT family protein [Candidatus Aminicenantales bacterium]
MKPEKSRGLLPFTRKVRDLVRRIPSGKVISYGRIAALAGDGRQARQVAWILHATPEREGLAWHRVIGSRGRISLPPDKGGREQAGRLRAEGIRVGPGGTVDIRKYGWKARAAIGRKPPLSDRDLEEL